MVLKKAIISLFVVLTSVMSASVLLAESVSIYRYQLALTYQLAKKIKWPESDTRFFRIHLYSRQQRLIREFKSLDREIAGKKVSVTDGLSLPEQVDLVFIDKRYRNRLNEAVEFYDGKPVLIVSNGSKQDKRIMIDMTVEKPEEKFRVNRKNLLDQGLVPDVDIVVLGGSEVDIARIFHEAQDQLIETREKLAELKQENEQIQQQLQRDREKLGALKAQQKQMVADYEKEVQSLNQQYLDKERQIKSIEEEYSKLQSEVEAQSQSLAAQREAFKQQQADLERQSNLIASREEILERKQSEIHKLDQKLQGQQQKIEQQEEKIQLQQQKLAKQIDTISAQKTMIYLLVVIGIMAFILIFNHVRSSRQQKVLNEELIAAKLKADDASRAKSLFLANMSHEIRTPINAIMGMHYLLRKTLLNPLQSSYLHKAHSATTNLLGIINDILDFSKIEAGKLELEHIEFSLNELIKNVSNVLSYKIEEKGLELLIDLDSDVPERLIGDPLRIGQVLINLGNNAIKFTENGEVLIKISIVEHEGNALALKFSVKDSGIGLTDDAQQKLFKQFSQADNSTTRKHGGTGLGLAICKQLTELMGGEIWLEHTEVNVGSMFSFTVKLGIGSENSQIQMEQVRQVVKGFHALVADDNASSRQILCEIMLSLGFSVEAVASGAEALAAVRQGERQRPFKVIIMDWKMPGMDGFEALQEIRNINLLEQPKIIMVTAYGREEIVQKIEKEQIDGFLIKPITPSAMLDTLVHSFGFEDFIDITIEREEQGKELLTPKGAKVLLVEDHPINSEFAIEILTSHGYKVDWVMNGKQAIEKIQNKKYHAVLMDVQMPVMDGLTATRKIRGLAASLNDTYYKDIPIIAMTANAMSGDAAKSESAGMNIHLCKPLEPEKLFESLSMLVQQFMITRGQKAQLVLPAKIQKNTIFDYTMLYGIDVDGALKRIVDNEYKLVNILEQFAHQYQQGTQEIEAAVNAGEIEKAKILIHALKGVSGTVSAHEVFQITKDIESEIDSTQEINRAQLKQLDEALSAVVAGIIKCVEVNKLNLQPKSVEKEGSSTPDNSDLNFAPEYKITSKKAGELLAIIDALDVALENDIAQATECVETLNKNLKRTEMREHSSKMLRAINQFDTDALMPEVSKIRSWLKVIE